MDEESKQLLRQLVDAQREQIELLRRHVLPLWTRIRFSLLALFVLMTLMATGIGFTVLGVRSLKVPAGTATISPAAPTGDLLFTPVNPALPDAQSFPTAPLRDAD